MVKIAADSEVLVGCVNVGLVMEDAVCRCSLFLLRACRCRLGRISSLRFSYESNVSLSSTCSRRPLSLGMSNGVSGANWLGVYLKDKDEPEALIMGDGIGDGELDVNVNMGALLVVVGRVLLCSADVDRDDGTYVGGTPPFSNIGTVGTLRYCVDTSDSSSSLRSAELPSTDFSWCLLRL